MVHLHRIVLVCLLLGLAAPALAGREIHVVAVGKGHQTHDLYALPVARVLVDRPGQEVGLVLLDGGALHWKVEASDGTIISEIIRSGPNPKDSRVNLSGIPMNGELTAGLPLVFRPWGRDFRSVVESVADMMATDRISSFQGVHKVGQAAVTVDHVDTETAGLARDYLTQQLSASDDLPPDIRNWIRNGSADRDFTVEFDETGFTLTGPEGTQRFPASADIPKIVLPVAGVYDAASQTIYGTSFGGPGYLYAVDVLTREWSVFANLNEYDSAGLLLDADSRHLILTGAFSRPGDIRIFGLDGSRDSVFIPTTGFPGLTDLFDYGNEHGPPLIPLAYRDGWLLVKAVASGDSADPNSGAHRIYAVQIATAEVRLLEIGTD